MFEKFITNCWNVFIHVQKRLIMYSHLSHFSWILMSYSAYTLRVKAEESWKSNWRNKVLKLKVEIESCKIEFNFQIEHYCLRRAFRFRTSISYKVQSNVCFHFRDVRANFLFVLLRLWFENIFLDNVWISSDWSNEQKLTYKKRKFINCFICEQFLFLILIYFSNYSLL